MGLNFAYMKFGQWFFLRAYYGISCWKTNPATNTTNCFILQNDKRNDKIDIFNVLNTDQSVAIWKWLLICPFEYCGLFFTKNFFNVDTERVCKHNSIKSFSTEA